jgi:hypothetical protein
MEPSRAYDWILKPEEAALVRRLVNEVLLPQSEKIRSIGARGELPLVCLEPIPELAAVFGMESVKAMPKEHLQKLRYLDAGTRKWIDRKVPRGMVKIFAVIHLGTFLFNWVSGHDLFIEPGSLDHEWKR